MYNQILPAPWSHDHIEIRAINNQGAQKESKLNILNLRASPNGLAPNF